MGQAEAEKVVTKYFCEVAKGDIPNFTYKVPNPALKKWNGLVIVVLVSNVIDSRTAD